VANPNAWSDEDKAKILEAVANRGDKSVQAIADEWGVAIPTIYGWKRGKPKARAKTKAKAKSKRGSAKRNGHASGADEAPSFERVEAQLQAALAGVAAMKAAFRKVFGES
jgi:transposase-like protein